MIEASADGLEKSRIEIEFVGDNVYREGVTPIVSYRPYVRFVREQGMSELQTFGRNNPVFASSSKEGHAPGMAADGNPDTYWKAANGDTSPYWILDTEKFLELKEIELGFLSGKSPSYYIVEISDDKESWNTICDNPQIEKADTTHRLVLDKGKNTGRFIRIKFADWKEAILSELLVKGTVL